MQKDLYVIATYGFALASAAIVAPGSKAGYVPMNLATFLILTLPIIPGTAGCA